MIRHSKTLMVGASALVWAMTMAGDAVAIDTPASVEPGRLEQQFKIDQRPFIDGAPMLQQQEAPLLSEDTGGPQFELKSVAVTGSTVFSEAELAALYQDRIGQPITLGGVRAIANKITSHYRNDGYILVRAFVPPQTVEGGAVTIQVVEGFIDAVVFEGAEEQNKELLESYGEQITAERPITNAMLEHYLLLIDDITGIRARGVLSPSQTNPGSSSLIVSLGYAPVEGEAFINNRGSVFLGEIQMGAMVGLNSMLGLSERIQLRNILSEDVEELQYYEGSYQQPVGAYGTTLRGAVTFADTAPGSSLKSLDIDGQSLSFTFGARHPFLRSRKENIFGTAGVRYRNSSSDILTSELYDDHIRNVYVGGSYDLIDLVGGINRVDAELVQGLNILDGNQAGDLLSRANGENNFIRMEATYSRLQPLSEMVSAFVSVYGQYSPDTLLASEEFSVGGESFGSAYDSSEISGDSGFAARAELRYSDSWSEAFMDVYQLYAFYDGGRVYNRDVIAGEESRESITSTGVGVRMTLAEDFAATLEVAKPLTQDVSSEGANGDHMRGFFSLVYTY